MVFYCHDCREEFDELYNSRELIGEYMGFPAYQIFGYCPYCKGDNYDSYTREELDKLLYGADEDEEMEETE